MSVPTTPTGVPVPRRVVVILLLVIPLSQIPLDIYTPALPQMVLDLDSSAAVVQNTVTAYMLGMSLAFIPVGLIADAVGRKRTLLTCLTILVVTSVGCALVQNITVLLGLRFVQGIGGCACLVLAYAIAADCYRGARLTSVSGLLGAAWGLAPVLAPAVGGVLVQFMSWRLVFGLIALLAALAVPLVFAGLPETLPKESRSPVDATAAARVLRAALRHRLFVGFVLVFGLMASAQMVFGVVAPFLYQEILGFSPAAYGAVALVVGGANLLGELACSALAVRVGTRRLAFGAWWVFVLGALVLAVTAGMSVVTAPAITIGACLALAGCGVLCPQMYGLALGLFTRNLGLIGGVVTAACYLVVSAAMAVAGVLPENSQAPLGWLYLALGAGAGILLLLTTSARQSDSSPTEAPAPRTDRR
ncbi:multidrug effflux MFS transporter [Rhodococcus koreensis]|uniref:MFS transporter, DHA1 family, bicyclomycin/chloramphenicol resistance protein n=1 Tax=Rhodococcus koreensis TaxID=99653 RepID=A0A1H5AR94_9NOCA|nr:multidrug effflux MFS transporter [Rhodococcus koreensis]SED44949.1 MFS transporter, DHA1 family, bicyclomycin/chloramphenicol resistance protein [Rhodococcus koreensis]